MKHLFFILTISFLSYSIFGDNLTASRKAKEVKRKALEAVEAAEEALNNEMREKYRGELCVT